MKRLTIKQFIKMFGYGTGADGGYGDGFGYGDGDKFGCGSGTDDVRGSGSGHLFKDGSGDGDESPEDIISKKSSRLMIMI